MSYGAVVYNVMIAYPADVEQEKEAAKSVILEWNAANSHIRQLILQPVEWRTHSTPEMDTPPQTAINRQILDRSDLLVAIFGTTVGSPTDGAPSGTVAEIERHLKAGKPAMVYFSSAPVPRCALKECQSLEKLKGAYMKRGLCGTYSDANDFRTTFVRDLAIKLNDINSLPHLKPADTALQRMLGTDARELLLEALKDSKREILWIRADQGDDLQTNNRRFIKKGDPGSAARWKVAMGELIEKGLVEDLGGEVFSITYEGCQHESAPTLVPKETLDESKERILQLFGRAPGRRFTASQVARSLHENPVAVEVNLDELVEADYLHGFLTSGETKNYILDQKGKKYVVQNGLL